MQVCDFSRSFLTIRLDVEKKPPTTVSQKTPFRVNEIRWPVECSCRIDGRGIKETLEYVLCASCKTEQVNAQLPDINGHNPYRVDCI